MRPRVLLLARTTGYQTRSFGAAAEAVGVDLVFATDRCDRLDDPWRDEAIPVRFHEEEVSLAAILEVLAARPPAGVLFVGDRPAVLAARAAAAFGLAGNSPVAAAASCNKLLLLAALETAGLPRPWFRSVEVDTDPATIAATLSYPCVVKPLALSGSQGVMRADGPDSFVAAFDRLRALLTSPQLRAERQLANGIILVEGFIAGNEFAIEGVMHRGRFQTLAIFDKPEPLDGPFFEETIYVTPSSLSGEVQTRISAAVASAASAIGLWHGPVHAECRVNTGGVFVLEVAARPIGGLCARALRFVKPGSLDTEQSLEALLLRHAIGEDVGTYRREKLASGVMMIPIPRGGVFRGVSGVNEARQVPGTVDVRITAKADQLLVPLPEGKSYLGFIFARGASPAGVVRTLHAAHAALLFSIDRALVATTSSAQARTRGEGPPTPRRRTPPSASR